MDPAKVINRIKEIETIIELSSNKRLNDKRTKRLLKKTNRLIDDLKQVDSEHTEDIQVELSNFIKWYWKNIHSKPYEISASTIIQNYL